MTDSELDDLLRSADPFPDTAVRAPGVVAALDDLLEPLSSQGELDALTARRRRPSRKLVAAVAATGFIAVGGVAAASSSFSPVSNKAPDFASSVRAATVNLPLPPGDNIDNYIKLWQQGETGYLDRNQLLTYFSYDAVCAWQGYWLQEYESGGSAAADDALQTLQDIPTWPQWDFESDTSVRDSYRADAEAAAAGDAQPVRQDWAANCTSLPKAWATK